MVYRVQCFQAKARLLRNVTIIQVIYFKNYIFSNLHAQDFLICILECKLLTITHPHLQQDSVKFSSLAQSCPTLSDPMNHSTPGLPVHHQLQEFTQTHVHRVDNSIQPSHPLSSPSSPAPNPSQHQGFFK